ncbi:MAG: DnaJ domain-containing protein [Myxococcales bacterium]|nr:DnaJ domain-containing protein [Myxococcales bacterium]
MPAKIQQRLAKAKALHGKLEQATHYQVLGVSTTASPDDVRNAFRGLAREFHADVFARYDLSDDDRHVVQKVFIAVNKASEVLSDASKRAEYDLGLQHGVPKGAPPGAAAGMQIDQVFKAEKLVRDGILLIRNNQGPAAKEKLDEALTITPNDPLARAAQAYAEYLQVQANGNAPQMAGRTREKLEAITADYEARDEPFVYLGRIYKALNQSERAAAAFEKALAINPRCAEAGSELRFLQRQLQDGKGGKSKGLFGRKKS